MCCPQGLCPGPHVDPGAGLEDSAFGTAVGPYPAEGSSAPSLCPEIAYRRALSVSQHFPLASLLLRGKPVLWCPPCPPSSLCGNLYTSCVKGWMYVYFRFCGPHNISVAAVFPFLVTLYKCKTIISSWVVQKQATGQIWPMDCGLPTPDL